MDGQEVQPPGEDRLRAAGERINSLLDGLGAGGIVARERAEELVRQVTDLYGTGLEHILGILDERNELAGGTLDALIADDLISGLLIVHGLHPLDVPTRVGEALESVRPYLGSHGGDVELLEVTEAGVVRLRLLGSCDGCPSSSVTLKLAVEDAIEAAAPEVTAIEVEEGAHEKVPALIPIASLRVRLDEQVETPLSGSWEAAPEIDDLDVGDVAGFEVGGVAVLACRPGESVYAFLDFCPRCAAPMTGATLQRALAAPVGGGLLRCPTCRAHFDVRAAGACIEEKGLHLDPLPVLRRSGVTSVAVPDVAGSRR